MERAAGVYRGVSLQFQPNGLQKTLQRKSHMNWTLKENSQALQWESEQFTWRQQHVSSLHVVKGKASFEHGKKSVWVGCICVYVKSGRGWENKLIRARLQKILSTILRFETYFLTVERSQYYIGGKYYC